MSTTQDEIQDDAQDEIQNDAQEDTAEDVTPAEVNLTKFTDLKLSEELQTRLREKKFETTTPVQDAAMPLALTGRDLIIQAQTGSGKTLAYALPILQRLKDSGRKHVQGKPAALVVAPTRELAQQVKGVMQELSDDIQPVSLIGGVPIRSQCRELEKDSRVVIGTPGRILDCLRQRIISFRDCNICVLDEVDEMFSMGFLEDVQAILSRLPRERQGLFVSATISPRVTMVACNFLNKPENIVVDEAGKDLPPIEHYVCQVGGGVTEKPEALCDIVETMRPASTIVFCNTKSDTELVEVFLRRRGFDARRLNSDLPQKQRDLIMNKIRAQELQLLVATDIAARGLDIEQIELIVNYTSPEEPELYLHRTGRTGRAGRSGKAVSLVGPQDFIAFHRISKFVGAEFETLALPTDEDVATARLSHLYQLLKDRESALSERDRLVASKFVKEVFGTEEVDVDALDLLTVLQREFVANVVKAETSSLDEELRHTAQDSGGQNRGHSGGNRRHQDSHRGGGRKGGGRGGRSGSGRGRGGSGGGRSGHR